MSTMPSYHLMGPTHTTFLVVPKWVLQKVIHEFSLVHQLHLVGDNNRYSQFLLPLDHHADIHVRDRIMNYK